MPEQILKKEDKLLYKGGFLNTKKGALVLSRANLSFETKKGARVFEIPLTDIVSANAQKGYGNGVEHLIVFYRANGTEKKAKIEHRSINNWAMGLASRIAPLYFASWEQIINDARFGKLG